MKKYIKRVKNKIIATNRDVLSIYRLNIHCSGSRLLKVRVIRYLMLFILLCRKFLLRQDVMQDRQKIKAGLCLKREGSLSKRPGAVGKAKMIMERDVVLFDITQVLISPAADRNQAVMAYEENPYGRLLFDVALQNSKIIILIWNGKEDEQDKVRELLREYDYSDCQDVLFCTDEPEHRRNQIQEYLSGNYGGKSSVYIGSYIRSIPDEESARRSVSVYQGCSFWGGGFRPAAGDNLHISIYNHLINNRLHNGMTKYSQAYELGYTYIGVILLYVFMQRQIRATSFAEEYERLREKMQQWTGTDDQRLTDRLLYIAFPPFLQNPVYDGTEVKNHTGLTLEQNIERYIAIHNAAADFMKDYEERLYTYSDRYIISEADITIILKFLFADTRRARAYLEF